MKRNPQYFWDVGGEREGGVMGGQATAMTGCGGGVVVFGLGRSLVGYWMRDGVSVVFCDGGGLMLVLFFWVGFLSGVHETPAGIAVSLFILLVVIMNLACEYSGIRSALNAGNNEQWRMNHILGFGVSMLWLFVEVTGIMLA